MTKAGKLPLLFLAGLVLLAESQKVPSKVAPAFNSHKYPPTIFRVTQNDFSLGDITVRIIEAKNRSNSKKVPHWCDAWLEIRKADQLLKRLYYNDIEPVGASYGIFIPNRQPSPDLFIATKEGDYDGRLLLVSKTGNVSDLRGGRWFVTSDKRFLVSEYSSDEAAITVMDLSTGRTVLTTEPDDVPHVDKWYRDGSGYFFTESDAPTNNDTFEAFRLYFAGGKISKVTIPISKLKRAKPVSYDFDPFTQKKQDCVSTPQ